MLPLNLSHLSNSPAGVVKEAHRVFEMTRQLSLEREEIRVRAETLSGIVQGNFRKRRSHVCRKLLRFYCKRKRPRESGKFKFDRAVRCPFIPTCLDVKQNSVVCNGQRAVKTETAAQMLDGPLDCFRVAVYLMREQQKIEHLGNSVFFLLRGRNNNLARSDLPLSSLQQLGC